METKNIKINPDLIWIIMLGTVALIAAVMLSRESPAMIVIIPVVLIIATIFLNNDELCLGTAIIILPFFASIPMAAYLLPIPGVRVSNLLLLLILLGFLLNRKLDYSGFNIALLFYLGSLTFSIVTIIRSGHVENYAMAFWYENYQPFKFFLSHGLIPILISLPSLMVIGSIRTWEQIQKIIYYIALSLGLFSTVIIMIYLFVVPPGSDFSTVREIIGINYFGMHGNNLADFIIIGFPLMLSMSLVPNKHNKVWFYISTILLLLAATLIYSRTAYATILLSIPIIIILTRKYRLMIPLIVLLVMLIIIMPGVLERAVTGLENGEHDIITAGRTDEIWRPVLREWQQQFTTAPMKAIIGYGSYGMLDFQAFKNQRILFSTHPHNMYLDTLINAGILGLLFYLILIGYVIVKLVKSLYRRLKRESDEARHITIGLLVAILCFMIRGMTDSFLIPHLTNSFFYIIMALAFVVIWQNENTRREEEGI